VRNPFALTRRKLAGFIENLLGIRAHARIVARYDIAEKMNGKPGSALSSGRIRKTRAG
jgi:hypothetical protein